MSTSIHFNIDTTSSYIYKNKYCFLPKPLRRHLWVGHGGKWKHWVSRSITAKWFGKRPLPQASSFAFYMLRRNCGTVSDYHVTWKQQSNLCGDFKFDKKLSVWKVLSFFVIIIIFFVKSILLSMTTELGQCSVWWQWTCRALDDNWKGICTYDSALVDNWKKTSMRVMTVDLSSVRWQLKGGLCIWSCK